MKIKKLKKVAFVLLVSALYSAAASRPGASARPAWVEASPNGNQFETSYLATKFEHISGSFPAISTSPSDFRTSLSGTFLVGQFKSVLKTPHLTPVKNISRRDNYD